MKKSETKNQEQERKPRRFSLNRETIRALNNPVCLELARGAFSSIMDYCCGPATSG